MTTTPREAWDISVCRRIDAIVEARGICKGREKDLTRSRDSIKKELQRLGIGDTPQHRELALDHWNSICGIERCRARIDMLADKMEETIIEARQGKIFEDNDDLEPDYEQPDPEAPKLPFDEKKPAAAAGSEKPAETNAAKPIEKHAEKPAKKSKRTQPLRLTTHEPETAETDQHLQASVNELDMRKNLKGFCLAAGCEKIVDVVRLIHAKSNIIPDCAEELRCTAEEAHAIFLAIDAWRKKHRKANASQNLEEARKA